MKRILFLSGTRADFGKIKSLILSVANSQKYEYTVFVTGMHTLSKYGYTLDEVRKAGFQTHVFMNQIHGEPMEQILANTISGLSRFVHEYRPDMIVVHGDRIESFAGAAVGALQNILVAHIEGGELSGTIDDLLRHAISKLSHLHFVSNDNAALRLKQMGEREDTIFTIGSPDIDIMLSQDLPSLPSVKAHYEIPFDNYAVAMFHPVTTEGHLIKQQADVFVNSLIKCNDNFIVIFPNNDIGSEAIFDAYEILKNNKSFRLFPSVRFESFLVLLKNARYIVGNSSAGIREAPIYSVPTVNIGSRQMNRFKHLSIIDVDFCTETIINAIQQAKKMVNVEPCHYFGKGNSVERFIAILNNEENLANSSTEIF